MDVENTVIAHYSRGNVEEAILAGVAASGKDREHFEVADLAGTDQLHIGGAAATASLAAGAGITAASRVLDIGSGMGGPARFFAHQLGATVHGVDLTPEFVAVAQSLTRRTGLAGQVTFSEGSALDLPLPDAAFDVATMIHVGMNIRDKDRVFAEAARVLKPGGVFAIYDVMRMGGDDPGFPLPWADTPEASFVQPPLAYTDALEQAGFDVDLECNRVELGISFVQKALAAMASGPGGGAATAPAHDALANVLAAFQGHLLAPVEIFSRKR